jgi:hypothetical protein
VAGFLAAGFVVTVKFAGDFLTACVWVADFLATAVFPLVSRAPACLAAGFLAALLDFCALARAVADLRSGERDAAAFWDAPFAAVRFVPERAGFGFVSLAAFGRETFTRPRMARPDDRPFAAAFAVARRVDLLCKVEAMGTTLVTVVTR